LHFLQKTFRIRNCRDSYFAHRSRPCLQHQIGRCSAPCVGLISGNDYAADIKAAVGILEGRDSDVTTLLGRDMEAAAERLEFEKAAELRDRIAAIKEVQARQVVRQAGQLVVAEVEHLQRVGQGKNIVGQFCQAARQIEAARARQCAAAQLFQGMHGYPFANDNAHEKHGRCLAIVGHGTEP
jgi:excinuclease UvrABC nuclease subunit